jgi:hypothetical protein
MGRRLFMVLLTLAAVTSMTATLQPTPLPTPDLGLRYLPDAPGLPSSPEVTNLRSRWWLVHQAPEGRSQLSASLDAVRSYCK